MPPGKGFYGPKYKDKSSGERKLTPMFLLAGVPVLALFAWIGACAIGGGSGSVPNGDTPPGGSSSESPATPTELPRVAPTRDPATKIAGENEGAGVIPPNAPRPDIKEMLIAGGSRFELPLAVHAGVEDYFGTPRANGKVHTGVDFSLVGLKNVPVESACNGFIIEAGNDDVYGTHVVIDCGADFKVVIGWLESLRVTDGNNVSKTTVVGVSETDGFVHFEIRYKDVPLDPKDFVQIPGKEVTPWTPTPSPTPRPEDTPTPEPTEVPTTKPGETPKPGGGTTKPSTSTPTLGPPTATPTSTSTPTITPTPTRTPTPTKTPVPPKNTPTPLPRSQ